MTRRKQGMQRGFTLIEIMVVVVIIGLLAAVVTQQLMKNVDTARISKARQDIGALEATLDIYALENYRYPTTEQGLNALIQKPTDPNLTHWNGPYLKRSSKDPWGNEYLYESPGKNGDYDLYTLGADGQPGGEGTNADIGNWNLHE